MPQGAFRGDRYGRKRDIDAEDRQSGRVKAAQDAKLNLQLRFSQRSSRLVRACHRGGIVSRRRHLDRVRFE